MNESFPTVLPQETKKEELLRELETEPLKYALGIENVSNAKELLGKLSEYETKAGFEHVFAKLENSTDLEGIKVVFKSMEAGDIASFRQATNTLYLYIDSTYSNSAEVGDFYITILHELLHAVFKGADIASGLNVIYGITSIKNTIEKLPVHNKYRHLYSTVLHNISKEEKGQHYGLSSVDEFISEAYSNPKFQNFLKTVELKKSRSISSKTTDLLLSVVTMNARIVSGEITQKDAFSAFEHIDLNSLNLLEDFEENIKKYQIHPPVQVEEEIVR
jgi:hypothetical protein